jgi:hypothetical protein
MSELFLNKTWKVSLSIGIRITMIRCVVYLLLIFEMVYGVMINPVYIYNLLYTLLDLRRHVSAYLRSHPQACVVA